MKRCMKTICGRIVADIKEYGMAVLMLLLYTVVVNLVFHAFCPVVIFSGYPCPGCGITRAAVCLMTGRWKRAWQFNPVIFPIALTAVYVGWNRYLMGRKAKGIKWFLAVLFLLLIVVYIVRMWLYFPDREPYVYAEDNMLAHIFTFYQQIVHVAGIL